MAKGNYGEGKTMAARAILDAIAADSEAALVTALDEYESYESGAADDGEESMAEEPKKAPSIALILAKRSKRDEAD